MTHQATASATAADGKAKRQAQIRLSYLDGIRGLTALYVCVCARFFQDFVACSDGQRPASLLTKLLVLTQFGGYAVSTFLVLSGYWL